MSHEEGYTIFIVYYLLLYASPILKRHTLALKAFINVLKYHFLNVYKLKILSIMKLVNLFLLKLFY